MFASPIDPGALLARSYPVADGVRVRLRLARPRDAGWLAALLARAGVAADDLELRRALTFDPRRRAVIAALGPAGAGESLMALGGIDLGAAAPDLLLADGPPELRELLEEALVARARMRGPRVA